MLKSKSFIYLGVNIHNTSPSEHDIRKHIAIACNCMTSLDHNIWHSSISLPIKLQFYRVLILPVNLYGAKTWSPTRQLVRNLDAFDLWCLRHIHRESKKGDIILLSIGSASRVSRLLWRTGMGTVRFDTQEYVKHQMNGDEVNLSIFCNRQLRQLYESNATEDNVDR